MYFYGNGILGTLPSWAVVLMLGLLALPFALVAASATFGAALLTRSPDSALLGLLFFSYLLPHALILSEDRFHFALVPFFAILAAGAWLGTQRTASAGFSLWFAAGSTGLLVLNWALQLARLWPTLARLIGPDGSRLHMPY